MNDRLTLNLGLRYDYVDGMPLDQSTNPNFQALQAAGRGRTVRERPVPRGLRPGAAQRQGQHPAARRRRLRRARRRPRRHPRRLGRLHRLRLHQLEHPVPGARRGRRPRAGVLRQRCRTASARRTGSFFTPADPISTIAHLNEVNTSLAPLFGQVVSPRLEQPYTRQTQRRLGAPARLGDGADRRLRARRRPRHQHPASRPNTLVNGGRAGWPTCRCGRTPCRSAPRSARARAPTTG